MWRVCQGQAQSSVDVVKDSNEIDQLGIFLKTTAANHPFEVSISVNGKLVNFAVDTRASVGLMSKQTWCCLSCLVLASVNTVLHTYTGELIKPLCLMDVVVHYREQQAVLPLHVLDGPGPSLLHREWLHTIRLDWADIYSVHTPFQHPLPSWRGS